jgi:hypothetical protein
MSHLCQGQRQSHELKMLYAVKRLVNLEQSWPTVIPFHPRLEIVFYDAHWRVRGGRPLATPAQKFVSSK